MIANQTQNISDERLSLLISAAECGMLCLELPDNGPIEALLLELRALRASHKRLVEALEDVQPYMEAAETAGLVGDEGCHWPVENVRVVLAEAAKLEGK